LCVFVRLQVLITDHAFRDKVVFGGVFVRFHAPSLEDPSP
jgi:hypothetical protein